MTEGPIDKIQHAPAEANADPNADPNDSRDKLKRRRRRRTADQPDDAECPAENGEGGAVESPAVTQITNPHAAGGNVPLQGTAVNHRPIDPRPIDPRNPNRIPCDPKPLDRRFVDQKRVDSGRVDAGIDPRQPGSASTDTRVPPVSRVHREPMPSAASRDMPPRLMGSRGRQFEGPSTNREIGERGFRNRDGGRTENGNAVQRVGSNADTSADTSADMSVEGVGAGVAAARSDGVDRARTRRRGQSQADRIDGNGGEEVGRAVEPVAGVPPVRMERGARCQGVRLTRHDSGPGAASDRDSARNNRARPGNRGEPQATNKQRLSRGDVSRMESSERADRTENGERFERVERSAKVSKVDKAAKAGRVDAGDRADRADRSGGTDRGGYADKNAKPVKAGRAGGDRGDGASKAGNRNKEPVVRWSQSPSPLSSAESSAEFSAEQNAEGGIEESVDIPRLRVPNIGDPNLGSPSLRRPNLTSKSGKASIFGEQSAIGLIDEDPSVEGSSVDSSDVEIPSVGAEDVAPVFLKGFEPEPEVDPDCAIDIKPWEAALAMGSWDGVLCSTVVVRSHRSYCTGLFDAGDHVYGRGENVAVETESCAPSTGVVVRSNRRELHRTRLPRVIRRAHPNEIGVESRWLRREQEVFSLARRVASDLGLAVKLVRAQTVQGGKILVYVATEDRIDFREMFRRVQAGAGGRIEIRQIGVRDEAKMLGGVAPCGLRLCCGTFLKDFTPVSIKMAKDQGLVLSPQRVSGLCGRLLCCLTYEDEIYRSQRRGMPKPGRRVQTPSGAGRVRDADVLSQVVRVVLDSGEIVTFDPSEVSPLGGPGEERDDRHCGRGDQRCARYGRGMSDNAGFSAGVGDGDSGERDSGDGSDVHGGFGR